MTVFQTFSRFKLIALMVLGLSGCTGLNFGTANALQSLDFLNDDIAEMTFAVDAPVQILPQDEGVLFEMDVVTAQNGERHIRAVLVRGDFSEAVSQLKPPLSGRAYHLFAFGETDKEAIGELQAWARELQREQGQVGGELTVKITPSFCRTSSADASDLRVSVLVSLPGKPGLNPLLSNVKLSDLGGAGMLRMPLCQEG